jgi:heme oxygenase
MATLKEQTSEKHKEAETQPFIKSIFQKNVDKDRYAEYLYQLYLIYHAMENLAAPKFNLLDDIADIKRASLIFEDFKELSKDGKTYYITEATLKYINHILDITDAEKLMAHIYVRHMGDLYGGQMMAKLVPGSGKMFEFNNKDELINKIRSKLNDDMGPEACVAFDYNIALVKEYN